jgi:hypothetical protein
MHVQVTLRPSPEGEEYREKSFHAVPPKTVERLMEAHNNYHNEAPDASRSVSYSFERMDGGRGMLSLDLEMVASIDAFEEDDGLSQGGSGRDPLVA